MSTPIITVENLSKRYRLGQIGMSSLRESTERFFRRWQRPSIEKNQQLSNEQRTTGSPDFWALRDVSFEVERGEVLGVIGRNGAGKSTLLKILSRITEPTSGRAILRGRVASLLEVGTGFHPELTGRENIYLNGAILGMRKAEIRSKFDEIVAFAELDTFIDTPVKRYSSGMYVRLAFAVAAHLDPEILLVDEVLAVGDAAFQEKCLGKMQDVAKGGRTVIFVSHNLNAVQEICNKSIILQGGYKDFLGGAREGVCRYIEEILGQNQEKIYTKQETSEGKICDVSISTNGRLNVFQVDYRESFEINIEFELLKKAKNLIIGIKVKNIRNITVIHTATCDATERNRNQIYEPGKYKATLNIPGQLLAPGRYICSEIGLYLASKGHVDRKAGSIKTFEICGRHFESQGDEIIRPNWPWEVINVEGMEIRI